MSNDIRKSYLKYIHTYLHKLVSKYPSKSRTQCSDSVAHEQLGSKTEHPEGALPSLRDADASAIVCGHLPSIF